MRASWIASIALFVPMVVGAATPARQESVGIGADPQGIPVEELIARAQEIVGGAWLLEPRDLKDVRVHLAGNVEVTRDRFLGFFERCLASQDLLHVEHPDAGVTTHRVMKLGQQARGQNSLKTNARTVSAAELAALAERHTLVTTLFEAKHVPARELVTTLNLYFADSATESIRNVEGTDQIVATGFTDNLARVAGMIRDLEAAAADDPEVATQRELVAAQQQLAVRVDELERRLKAAGGK